MKGGFFFAVNTNVLTSSGIGIYRQILRRMSLNLEANENDIFMQPESVNDQNGRLWTITK